MDPAQRILLPVIFLLGLAIGGLAFLFAMRWSASPVNTQTNAEVWTSPTPGMAALDRYSCPAGTLKRMEVRGLEDRFDRSNVEEVRLSDGMDDYAVHKAKFERRGQVDGSRDYDEMGPDKNFYDYIDVEAGLTDGFIVLGHLQEDLENRDGLGIIVENSFSPSDTRLSRNVVSGAASLSAMTKLNEDEGAYRVVSAGLADFRSPGMNRREDGSMKSLLDFLTQKLPSRPAHRLTFVIGNDTPVDFLGLASCHEPQSEKGMSWASSDLFRESTQLHLMSCNFDLSLPYCDSSVGDTVCSEALPVACFREGDQEPPNVPSAQVRIDANFSGGDIRLTAPVTGDSLKRSTDADRLCEASFGTGWRVLDHHEAGGDLIMSYSKIPHGARAWVDIRTMPSATCWARP